MESILKRLQNLGKGRQKDFLNTSSIEYLRVPFLKGMWNRGRRRHLTMFLFQEAAAFPGRTKPYLRQSPEHWTGVELDDTLGKDCVQQQFPFLKWSTCLTSSLKVIAWNWNSGLAGSSKSWWLATSPSGWRRRRGRGWPPTSGCSMSGAASTILTYLLLSAGLRWAFRFSYSPRLHFSCSGGVAPLLLSAPPGRDLNSPIPPHAPRMGWDFPAFARNILLFLLATFVLSFFGIQHCFVFSPSFFACNISFLHTTLFFFFLLFLLAKYSIPLTPGERCKKLFFTGFDNIYAFCTYAKKTHKKEHFFCTGEFPLKLKIHFHHPEDRPLSMEHQVKQ